MIILKFKVHIKILIDWKFRHHHKVPQAFYSRHFLANVLKHQYPTDEMIFLCTQKKKKIFLDLGQIN